MTLNEFTTLVYNNLFEYVRNQDDLEIVDFTGEQTDAIKNQIRSTIRETSNIYDGNNFPLVVID